MQLYNGYKSTFPWINLCLSWEREIHKSTFVVVGNDKTISSEYLAWRGLKMNSIEMSWVSCLSWLRVQETSAVWVSRISTRMSIFWTGTSSVMFTGPGDYYEMGYNKKDWHYPWNMMRVCLNSFPFCHQGYPVQHTLCSLNLRVTCWGCGWEMKIVFKVCKQ